MLWAKIVRRARQRGLARLVREMPAEIRKMAVLAEVRDVITPLVHDTSDDPYHLTTRKFYQRLRETPAVRVLEVGSWNSTIRRTVPDAAEWVGMDIRPGPSVDVVGDAHELSRVLPDRLGQFDAVLSQSVFEHLLMPWKAVLEMNALLKDGGLLFISTHSAWPPHELPWDFWRYPVNGFDAILNWATGFEIVEAAAGLPCTFLPFAADEPCQGALGPIAHMGVSVIARKVGPPSPAVHWDVPLSSIVFTHYPTS